MLNPQAVESGHSHRIDLDSTRKGIPEDDHARVGSHVLDSTRKGVPRAGSRANQPPVADETAVRGRLDMDFGALFLPISAAALLPFPAGHRVFPARLFAVRPKSEQALVSRAESVSRWAARQRSAGRWLWSWNLTMVALSPSLLFSAWRPAGDRGRCNDKPGCRSRQGIRLLVGDGAGGPLAVATAACGSPGV